MMEDVRYTDGFSEHPEDHEQDEAPGLESSSEECKGTEQCTQPLDCEAWTWTEKKKDR